MLSSEEEYRKFMGYEPDFCSLDDIASDDGEGSIWNRNLIAAHMLSSSVNGEPHSRVS